jgi:hypothetical protein
MAVPVLEQFLRHRFSPMDAGLLMVFFNHLAGRDFFSDGDLDIPEAEKKDLILLGYEERLFLPVKTKSGPAWEDRIMDFDPTAVYGIPRVVRTLPEAFQESGGFSFQGIVEATVSGLLPGSTDPVVPLLEMLIPNCRARCFEVGLLSLFYERFRFDLDLHGLLDFFVISGMMSACPQKSLRTGLSFYEVSPVLFWGNPVKGGS